MAEHGSLGALPPTIMDCARSMGEECLHCFSSASRGVVQPMAVGLCLTREFGRAAGMGIQGLSADVDTRTAGVLDTVRVPRNT
jgi:hypothetical protein